MIRDFCKTPKHQPTFQGQHKSLCKNEPTPSSFPFIHLISSARLGRNMGKFEVLPDQETLNTTQRGQLSQLKILCYANSPGARTFESTSLCKTCLIFYSTFVTHPPCFNLLKNFHLLHLNDLSFLVIFSGERRGRRPVAANYELSVVLEVFLECPPTS